MRNRMVIEHLRYKDRGQIEYRIIEGFDGMQDCLELRYKDNEKHYEWEYYFAKDDKTTFEHIKSVTYEELKKGFVENLNLNGYYLHKGEYQLLKEAIVIFVSHKKYVEDICQLNGLC
jgi:hypothetical protein